MLRIKMRSYRQFVYTALHLMTIATFTAFGAQIPTATRDALITSTTNPAKQTIEPTVRVKCLAGAMLITIKDAPPNFETGLFSGMIYPKGLSKNSTCLTEYRDFQGPLKYKLPLRSCNTMPQETEEGGIEFFNTIVLQPHLKLITGLGRGYHLRCAYKSREAANGKHKKYVEGKKQAQKPQAFRSAEADSTSTDRRGYGRSLDLSFHDDPFNEDEEFTEQEHNEISDIPMPGCHMKIYNEEHKIADDEQLGDPLTIVISIDKQDLYGLHVQDCIVRDGLGWGEQRLISSEGCPMDNEIMGQFTYSSDRLAANVTFPAHKFPYTTSVYYQCNVRLCPLKDAECQTEPVCNGKRPKRQTNSNKDDEGQPALIEVYSGLYVHENADVADGDDADSVFKEKTLDDALCVSQRTFAIAIAIAGLILMLAVVAAVLCIMARRSTKTVSNSGSSIYSGPYTNTAFSHSS